jgi:hypothetical protein
VDFGGEIAVDFAGISVRRQRRHAEGRVVTGTATARRDVLDARPEPGDGFGLGRSLALSGLLAAMKLAETATGVVLSAAGVLPGAHPERAPVVPGGE